MKETDSLFKEGLAVLFRIKDYVDEKIVNFLYLIIISPVLLVGVISRFFKRSKKLRRQKGRW